MCIVIDVLCSAPVRHTARATPWSATSQMPATLREITSVLMLSPFDGTFLPKEKMECKAGNNDSIPSDSK